MMRDWELNFGTTSKNLNNFKNSSTRPSRIKERNRVNKITSEKRESSWLGTSRSRRQNSQSKRKITIRFRNTRMSWDNACMNWTKRSWDWRINKKCSMRNLTNLLKRMKELDWRSLGEIEKLLLRMQQTMILLDDQTKIWQGQCHLEERIIVCIMPITVNTDDSYTSKDMKN